jgi:hypothetical protein
VSEKNKRRISGAREIDVRESEEEADTTIYTPPRRSSIPKHAAHMHHSFIMSSPNN